MTDLDKRVAERLGWRNVRGFQNEWFIGEPPEDSPPWLEPTSTKGVFFVPSYLRDWRATGWLMDRYEIGVCRSDNGEHLVAWMDDDIDGTMRNGIGQTRREAVCNLIAEHGVPE